MMGKKHLLYMAGGVVAVFVVMVALGVPSGTALVWGLLLACPLMMVTMMFSMGGNSHSAPSDGAEEQKPSDGTQDADGQHHSRR